MNIFEMLTALSFSAPIGAAMAASKLTGWEAKAVSILVGSVVGLCCMVGSWRFHRYFLRKIRQKHEMDSNYDGTIGATIVGAIQIVWVLVSAFLGAWAEKFIS